MFEASPDKTSGPGTVVGANVKLTGAISDINDITVHGTVEGEVVSDKNVTISETANIKGPVTAEIISVSGKINGAVTAHQRLELLPSAEVSGSINTKELIVKSGARLNGKCTMPDTDITQASDKNVEEKPKKSIKFQEKKSPKIKEEMSASLPKVPTFELED